MDTTTLDRVSRLASNVGDAASISVSLGQIDWDIKLVDQGTPSYFFATHHHHCSMRPMSLHCHPVVEYQSSRTAHACKSSRQTCSFWARRGGYISTSPAAFSFPRARRTQAARGGARHLQADVCRHEQRDGAGAGLPPEAARWAHEGEGAVQGEEAGSPAAPRRTPRDP